MISTDTFAYDFEVDGIYYNLINGKYAEVTSGNNRYSGDVVIPEKITYEGVEYPVESIGDYAFSSCTSLTVITIGNSVTSIGEYAFQDSGLTTITIGNSVTDIGEGAFSNCFSLTSFTIPNSVTSIGNGAFSNCFNLTSITIPSSVTSIGNGAFKYCFITSIKVDADNNKYDSRDNCNAIIETSTNTLITGCKNTIIPNSVTSIGGSAFNGCLGLTAITIPNSVTSIGRSAFEVCI